MGRQPLYRSNALLVLTTLVICGCGGDKGGDTDGTQDTDVGGTASFVTTTVDCELFPATVMSDDGVQAGNRAYLCLDDGQQLCAFSNAEACEGANALYDGLVLSEMDGAGAAETNGNWAIVSASDGGVDVPVPIPRVAAPLSLDSDIILVVMNLDSSASYEVGFSIAPPEITLDHLTEL